MAKSSVAATNSDGWFCMGFESVALGFESVALGFESIALKRRGTVDVHTGNAGVVARAVAEEEEE